ncbi:hypothetical protein PV327_008109 [Microctonus hyperodae]|uniref:Odorant receptor n=1 Tax=Microctonus hyperodae TaxID=165561 RepID=A0AA39F2F0_MICHY|nr:hypothetical protein PV327_008109 [Microctonus hyperodae]
MMKDNWKNVDTKQEEKIMHEYAEIGRQLSNLILVAADGTYGIYACHVCGMFDIVRHQFANISFHREFKDGLSSGKNQTFKNIVDVIEKHKKAIRFSDTIESTYVYLVLGIFGLGIASISISGVQMMLYFNNPLEEIRYCLMCLSYSLHIFYYTWNGQNILNHSYKIYEAAYNTEWYTILDKPTKLLITVILRSSKPCIQTAGKIFPLNLMSFSMIKWKNLALDLIQQYLILFTCVSSLELPSVQKKNQLQKIVSRFRNHPGVEIETNHYLENVATATPLHIIIDLKRRFFDELWRPRAIFTIWLANMTPRGIIYSVLENFWSLDCLDVVIIMAKCNYNFCTNTTDRFTYNPFNLGLRNSDKFMKIQTSNLNISSSDLSFPSKLKNLYGYKIPISVYHVAPNAITHT